MSAALGMLSHAHDNTGDESRDMRRDVPLRARSGHRVRLRFGWSAPPATASTLIARWNGKTGSQNFTGRRLLEGKVRHPMSRHVSRAFGAVAAGFALTASGLAPACATSAARPGLSGRAAQPATICCGVSAVAATSARNAWAVGGGPRTVILHWNGTAWKRVPSPGHASSTFLTSVAVISADDAWAVGYTSGPTGKDALMILHWNGTTWKQVPSPNPSAGTVLDGVTATSADDAWAVGYTGMGPSTCRRCATLILHWNGTTWKRVPSPNPSAGSVLDSVAATSAGNAWAVGYTPSLAGSTLILHWNGKTWRRVPSPNPAAGVLESVAAASARSAWAVGYSHGGTLILHWNGKTWRRVPSPNPAAGVLESVAAASAHSAWAAGNTGGGNTMILHWNGTAWEQVRSPNPTPGHGENLTGVAATSARNAWVVGYAGGGGQALIAHWNGVSWMT